MLSDSLNLHASRRVFRRRKRLVVGVISVFALLGLCLDLFIPPTYRATVRLEIRRPPQRLPISGQPSGSENFQSETASLFTTAQLITNRQLLEQLMNRLDHATPAVAASWAPDPPGVVHTPWGRMSFTRALGRAEAATAVTAQSDPQQFERTLDWLQTIIQVEPVKDTRLVDIKVEHRDPAVAKAMADELSRMFVDFQVRRSGNADPVALASIESQIQEVRQRIQAASSELGPDVAATASPAMEDVATARLRQSLATIGEAATRAHADRIEADARLASLRAVAENPARSALAPFDGDGVNSIRRDLISAQTELAAARQVYRDEHPKVQDLKTRVTALQGRLRDEVRREESRLAIERSAMAARERGLQSQASQEMNNLASLEQRTVRASVLTTELKADQDLYARLIGQAREMRLAYGSGDPSAVIVQPAALEQPDPVRPHRVLNLIICLLAGVLFGAGAALVAESLRRGLFSSASAEKALGVPVLAVVPRHA